MAEGRRFRTREEDKEFSEGFRSGSPQLEMGNPFEWLMEKGKGMLDWWRDDVIVPGYEGVRDSLRDRQSDYEGMEGVLGERAESREQGGAVEGLGEQRVSAGQFQEFWQGLTDEDKRAIQELEENQPEIGQKMEQMLDEGDFASVIRMIRRGIGR